MLKNKNNVISFVEENVKKESQKNIFIYSKNGEFQKMTNNEFFEKVLKFSNILKKNKIKKGDRVIIFLPISVELYIVLAGLQVLGAIPVFLESWSKINHIKTSIKNAQPKGIISLSKLFEKYGLFFRNFELKMSIDEPKNKGKVLSFYKELENSKKDAFIETVSADDTALITYTTGSSGSPKGADRTHKFLKAQHFALNKLFPYDKNDIDMPIFPVFALNNLAGGVTTVIPEIISSTNLSDKDIYKLTSQIKKLNINNLTLSPIIFNKLTSFSQKNNLIFPNIKRVLTGGAPISENDVFEFKKIVPNAKIWILYGSTEVEPISHIESAEMIKIMSELKFDNKNKTKQGVVVGKIHKDLDFAFIKTNFNDWKVDNIKDISVEKGLVGELIVSGNHVCEKYYKNDEAFKRAKIKEKNTGKIWHKTGDIARLDNNGNLWIVGRKHNLITRNNEVFFPVRPEILLKEIAKVEASAYIEVEIKNKKKIFAVLEGAPKEAVIKKIKEKFRDEKIPLDDIIFVEKIIMDIRHHSKVDYSAMRKIIKKDTKLNRWRKFLKERFCIIQILPMISVFVLAHRKILENNIFIDLKIIILIMVSLLFFLKLRLYDEIKDHKTDKKIYPQRPLSRGLLKIKDLKKVILAIIFIEILFFNFLSFNFMIFITIFYSLLMFKEFFISDWIKKHLTFYAVSHTIVVSLYSLSIFKFLKNDIFLNFNEKIFYFSLSSWFIFNLFEFGRKTFAKTEEKKMINSYSKNFTLIGALSLSLINTLIGFYFLNLSVDNFLLKSFFVYTLLLLLSILFFLKEKFGKIFRFYTTFIIFIIYFLIIF